jgi:hypothetical protein
LKRGCGSAARSVEARARIASRRDTIRLYCAPWE